MKSL
jgi:hypothetical protein